jgi:hypothetical protein
MLSHVRPLAAAVLALSLLAPAQTAYTPQFKGDPAHSTAEAAALGYMRTVLYAQRVYHKKHAAYATSLAELVGSSSFTRRMINTERGDYTVHFTSTNAGKNFSLSMVPKQFDPAHRAFFADDTGTIRAESDQPASASSPKLKAD